MSMQGYFDWGSVYPDVINVGAWNQGSNGGLLLSSLETIPTLDILADGYVEKVGWGANFGTSFATPKVAASLANYVNDFIEDLNASGSSIADNNDNSNYDSSEYAELVAWIVETLSTNVSAQFENFSYDFPIPVLSDSLEENGYLPLTVSGLTGLSDYKVQTASLYEIGNTAPSGSASLSGIATQGETLTAITSSIADADGLGSFSYQWLRDGSTISGATSSTYALTYDDVGATVSVRVSYTDGQGTAESVTSLATTTVVETNTTDDHGDDASSSTAISIGATVSGSLENIADQDWFSVSMEAGKTYLLEPSNETGSEVTPVLAIYDPNERFEKVSLSEMSFQPETSGTYFLKITDSGDLDTGSYSFTTTVVETNTTDDHGDDASSSTAISIGATVSGSLENIADQDWFSVSMEAGKTYLLEPSNETGSEVTPVLAIYDPNERFEKVSLSEMSFQPETSGTYFLKITDSGDLDTGSYSFTTTVLRTEGNSVPTGSASISGTAIQGETLTAVTSSIADSDGLGSFSYQWLRDGSAISGATSSTYSLTSDDVSAAVSVRVSYTDGQGTAESLTSLSISVDSVTSDDDQGNSSSETLGAISATNTGSGANVSLDFYVDPSLISEDVTSFDMVVSFDSDGAEYVSADLDDFLGFANVSGETITLSGISLAGVSTSDPLFTINFTDLDTAEDLVINITDVLVNNATLESSTLLIGGPEALDVSVSVASRSGAALPDVIASFNDGSDITTATSSSIGVSTVAVTSGSDVIVTAALDYDGSTKAISSQDALDALKLSVGMTTSAGTKTAFDFISADFNQDGKVSSQDALAILKNAVGLPTTEQAEWVFVDTNGDYSGVSKSNTSYTEGVSIADLSADTTVEPDRYSYWGCER